MRTLAQATSTWFAQDDLRDLPLGQVIHSIGHDQLFGQEFLDLLPVGKQVASGRTGLMLNELDRLLGRNPNGLEALP